MKHFVITFITCCLVQMGFSQEFLIEKLNSYLESLEQNNKFMGTVSVSRNGENIYSKSVGFSNIETKKRADQHTIYKIGSISKSFTAVMIFQ